MNAKMNNPGMGTASALHLTKTPPSMMCITLTKYSPTRGKRHDYERCHPRCGS